MSVLPSKDLSVGCLNIYHLANKVNDLNVFLRQSNFLHIFGVCKTRLTSDVSDDVLMIPNYSSLCREIALYVHDTSRDITADDMTWNLSMNSYSVSVPPPPPHPHPPCYRSGT